jgi:hypothetical protein
VNLVPGEEGFDVRNEPFEMRFALPEGHDNREMPHRFGRTHGMHARRAEERAPILV